MHYRLLLIAAAPFIMADGPPPRLHTWLVEQPITPSQTVDLNLIRARVREVRTPSGPLKIKISAPPARLVEGVQIHIERNSQGVRVFDTYPALSATSECVPHGHPRGAFWRSDVVFDVLISAPPGVVTQVHVMDPRP